MPEGQERIMSVRLESAAGRVVRVLAILPPESPVPPFPDNSEGYAALRSAAEIVLRELESSLRKRGSHSPPRHTHNESARRLPKRP